MDKKQRIPHEGVRNSDDGLDAIDEQPDTEGHRQAPSVHGPGTGGDLTPRRPVGGGELIDGNDVEGHGSPVGPGTGGDVHGPGTGGDFTPRRPVGGGELIDGNDVEGHVR